MRTLGGIRGGRGALLVNDTAFPADHGVQIMIVYWPARRAIRTLSLSSSCRVVCGIYNHRRALCAAIWARSFGGEWHWVCGGHYVNPFPY